MKPEIFIAIPIPKEVENYIGQYCNYRKWEGQNHITREELLKEIEGVDGILTNCHTGGQIDDEFIDHASKVKVISNVSVGYNNFEIDIMKKRNVIGTHTPYVLDNTVADTAIALMLSVGRRITELNNYVKEGKWIEEITEDLFGIDVHHATIGIIGMGRVGQTIAKKAKLGFDMNVLYSDVQRKLEIEEKYDAEYCSMEDLLKKADYIVVMTPLTKSTYHLIDYKEFELMKETAVFINTSRGQTVNEEALIDALKNKKIYGAGLDVFEEEPVDINNPLLKMDNVVALPHIGTATAKTRFDMAMAATHDLVKVVIGEEPKYIAR